jgi:regulator of protease activity HflC (stomatin/prohibitin superfamily)
VKYLFGLLAVVFLLVLVFPFRWVNLEGTEGAVKTLKFKQMVEPEPYGVGLHFYNYWFSSMKRYTISSRAFPGNVAKSEESKQYTMELKTADGQNVNVDMTLQVSLRMKELVLLSLHASATSLNVEAIRRHIERAKAAGNQILEFANRKAAEIRTEGDRAAAGYYREFAKDERFSMFLRSLESLKKELESKSVILLDGSLLPAVGFFQQGPSLKPFDAPVPSAGTSPRTEPSQGK